MSALLRKEFLPFLAPGLVGMVLFTGLWVVVFDVESAFLDSPVNMLAAVMFLALNVGALLGYAQIALEREGSTLSYLVHRDVPLRRLLAAKCVAGWTLLALVVHAPVALCALIESRIAPLGPVLQWSRVWEIGVGGLIVLPAHAIGTFAATLRPAFGFRVAFAAFAAGGLGGAAAFFLQHPLAGPGPSQALFALACIALTAALLAGALRRAERMEDAERAPSPVVLATVLGVFALLIAAPGHWVISIVQAEVLRERIEARPRLAWSEVHGAAIVRHTPDGRFAVGPDGSTIAKLAHDPTGFPGRTDEGWIGVWAGDGRLVPQIFPRLERPRSRWSAPAVAREWDQLRAGRYSFSEDMSGSFVAKFYQDEGRFLVLRQELLGEFSDLPRSTHGRFLDVPSVVSLIPLARGDGRPFGRGSQSAIAAAGGPLGAEPAHVIVDDPTDGTSWECAWLLPAPRFRLVAEQRYWEPIEDASARLVGRHCVTGWSYRSTPPAEPVESVQPPADARVLPLVTGDLAASTVRLVDARTGSELLRHDDHVDGGWNGMLLRAVLYVSELLRAPGAVLTAHLTQDPLAALRVDFPPYTAWLTGAGRRPLLALANVALALLLAWRARRELAGAARWRRNTWTLAIALGGAAFWLAYLLAEPRPSAAPARAREPRLLLHTREVPA